MTSKAVVLAAGRGGRLERHTERRPKSLVSVAGRPLIYSILDALAEAGISDVVVVLGHHGEQIKAHVGDGRRFGLSVDYVWNTDYDQGNASSLWRALPSVANEPFLLVMGDHLCEPSLLRTFLDSVDGRSAIAVDRSLLDEERTAEATKVALADGLIADIGKGLERWDAIDTGFSYWTPGAFAAGPDGAPHGELAALIARLARTDGGLVACDVTGHFWLDIDTEDDVRLAERLLRFEERV